MKKFLMMAFAGVFVALCLCGCDSPKKAYNEFRDAIVAKDVKKAASRVYVKDAKPAEVEAGVEHMIKMTHQNEGMLEEAKSSKVIDVKIDGDKATFKVKTKKKTSPGKAIKVDGKWKLDLN